jgi:hypothetical protein
MKKASLIILLLSWIVVILMSAMISHAESESVVGKLLYYEYDAYPYVLELKNGKTIALEVELNKNSRNKSMDNLLGKIVRVTGPTRVVTAMTELHGLKIIDIRPGKGKIKPLK